MKPGAEDWQERVFDERKFGPVRQGLTTVRVGRVCMTRRLSVWMVVRFRRPFRLGGQMWFVG